jgi:putative DNA primase/helicase
MSNLERIRGALSFIPADDRETWLRAGMAIKSELGDAGFDLWDAWSRQADSYDAKDARDVWRSLKANGGVTAGTLFHEAKANGWRDDGAHRKPEEIEARRRLAAKEDAEKARRHAEAASASAAVWAAAGEVRGHPYLIRKGVAPVATLREASAVKAAQILGYVPKSRGEPLTGRLLVVPVTVAGELSTVELIDEAGRKSALFGGSKTGGYWAAQPLPDGDGAGVTLLLGEGVATSLSAWEATGHPAIAALSCGNLPAVARQMRERYPAAVLVVLADLVNDTGEPEPHAIEAARAVGGRLVVPDFGGDRDPAWTDLNDMSTHMGLSAVAECVYRFTCSKNGVSGVTG